MYVDLGWNYVAWWICTDTNTVFVYYHAYPVSGVEKQGAQPYIMFLAVASRHVIVYCRVLGSSALC